MCSSSVELGAIGSLDADPAIDEGETRVLLLLSVAARGTNTVRFEPLRLAGEAACGCCCGGGGLRELCGDFARELLLLLLWPPPLLPLLLWLSDRA